MSDFSRNRLWLTRLNVQGIFTVVTIVSLISWYFVHFYGTPEAKEVPPATVPPPVAVRDPVPVMESEGDSVPLGTHGPFEPPVPFGRAVADTLSDAGERAASDFPTVSGTDSGESGYVSRLPKTGASGGFPVFPFVIAAVSLAAYFRINAYPGVCSPSPPEFRARSTVPGFNFVARARMVPQAAKFTDDTATNGTSRNTNTP